MKDRGPNGKKSNWEGEESFLREAVTLYKEQLFYEGINRTQKSSQKWKRFSISKKKIFILKFLEISNLKSR